ncbi:MAG: hypothetical protein SR2Q5_06145 [Quinella sp. 2Q5]|nr:hypothetical protein [Quinella sp. 2Q5]
MKLKALTLTALLVLTSSPTFAASFAPQVVAMDDRYDDDPYDDDPYDDRYDDDRYDDDRYDDDRYDDDSYDDDYGEPY